MSRRERLALSIHHSYLNLRNVPNKWEKFVAKVFCHAAIMAWE